MRAFLHLNVGPLPAQAEALMALQKADPQLRVESLALSEENAGEALERIFAADSICVWSPPCDARVEEKLP